MHSPPCVADVELDVWSGVVVSVRLFTPVPVGVVLVGFWRDGAREPRKPIAFCRLVRED